MTEKSPLPDNFESIVLFEDNHLLVVAKPPGLLVQGDRTGRPNLLDLAKEYIRVKHQKPGRAWLGLVHRLDRQAGGVMVLARTSKAAGRLSAQFREHSIEKLYVAAVSGRPDPPQGTARTRLVRQGRFMIEAKPDAPEALSAELEYHTTEAGPTASLVSIRLITGRRHQIRAQFALLGHPLLGDVEYGSTVNPRRDSIALLSRSLTLDHPTTNERLTFAADPSPDWPWLPLE